MKSYKQIAVKYADDVLNEKIIIGKEAVLACKRFKDNLKRKDIELRSFDPDLVIGIIEKTMVHKQGESIDGTPLMGKPVELLPWQIFVIYNLVGWFYKGTNERVVKEAFIMTGRKNGKTSFLLLFCTV